MTKQPLKEEHNSRIFKEKGMQPEELVKNHEFLELLNPQENKEEKSMIIIYSSEW